HPYDRTCGSTVASKGSGTLRDRPSVTSTMTSGPGSSIRPSQRWPRLSRTCAPSGESMGRPAATDWHLAGGEGSPRVASRRAEMVAAPIQTWMAPAPSPANAVHATQAPPAPDPLVVGEEIAACVAVGEVPVVPEVVAPQAARA